MKKDILDKMVEVSDEEAKLPVSFPLRFCRCLTGRLQTPSCDVTRWWPTPFGTVTDMSLPQDCSITPGMAEWSGRKWSRPHNAPLFMRVIPW